MTNKLILLFAVVGLISCNYNSNSQTTLHGKSTPIDTSKVELYQLKNPKDSMASVSIGSVSAGKLQHGKLLPFEGINYRYFDTMSYLRERAYLNDKVLKTILAAYKAFDSELLGREFVVMECAHKNGGQLFPHRTHQNGLSVDFMMPLIKEGKPFVRLDSLGPAHYLLDFDNTGKWKQDTAVSIDFNLVAQHLVMLDSVGKPHQTQIQKVIINTGLKDELYASEYGKRLQQSNVYVVRKLTPVINSLHDDHYHVDFSILP